MKNLILVLIFFSFVSNIFSQVNQEINYSTSFDSNSIDGRIDTFTTNFLQIRHEINNKEKKYVNSYINFDGKTNHLIIDSEDSNSNYESNLIFIYESRHNDVVTKSYETLNDEIVRINYKVVNNIKVPYSVSIFSKYRSGLLFLCLN